MAHINLLPWRDELRKKKQQQFAVVGAGTAILGALRRNPAIRRALAACDQSDAPLVLQQTLFDRSPAVACDQSDAGVLGFLGRHPHLRAPVVACDQSDAAVLGAFYAVEHLKSVLGLGHVREVPASASLTGET